MSKNTAKNARMTKPAIQGATEPTVWKSAPEGTNGRIHTDFKRGAYAPRSDSQEGSRLKGLANYADWRIYCSTVALTGPVANLRNAVTIDEQDR